MTGLDGKKAFVTGGAGFIGSNLIRVLLDEGCSVTAFDNLSLGKAEHISPYISNGSFRFIRKDLLELDGLVAAMRGHDIVFHMAANSDISRGGRVTSVDLKQGTIATYNVLEAMRLDNVPDIVFASTSAVYGEAERLPTGEDYGPLMPISLYGASKLACEGLVSAYCHNFGVRAWIYRFGNIVGPNATHGIIFDFLNKLRKDPERLEVLGDGKQSKPYLHVRECVEGMLFGYRNSTQGLNVFNLACEGGTDAAFIANAVIKELGLSGARVKYTGTPRGWSGDVPFVRLDTGRMEKLGWKAALDSCSAAKRAVRELAQKAQEEFERCRR